MYDREEDDSCSLIETLTYEQDNIQKNEIVCDIIKGEVITGTGEQVHEICEEVLGFNSCLLDIVDEEVQLISEEVHSRDEAVQ